MQKTKQSINKLKKPKTKQKQNKKNVQWYETHACLTNSFGYNGWIPFCNSSGITVSSPDQKNMYM